MAGIVVGGKDAWKVRKQGELVVAYHWVGSGGNDPEPTMVLFPAYPSRDAGVVMIGLSAAYKYADSKTGEPTNYLLSQTVAFAKHMGMITTAGLLRKIADAVVDGLIDLIEMPPEPDVFEAERLAAEGKVGEMAILVDGQTVMETRV